MYDCLLDRNPIIKQAIILALLPLVNLTIICGCTNVSKSMSSTSGPSPEAILIEPQTYSDNMSPHDNSKKKFDKEDLTWNILNLATELKKKAELGDFKAQYELGHMYLEGSGAPKSLTMASYWFKKASEKGFAKAKFYDLIANTHIGIDKLVQCYVEEAVYGSTERKSELQIQADKSIEKLQNQLKFALHEIENLAIKNDAEAQYILSRMYMGVLPSIKDRNIAEQWCKKAIGNYLKVALQGDIRAQRALGEIYSFGDDEIEQVKWYEKAAEQGDPISQYRLGLHYIYTKKDYSKGILWLERSAQQGHFEAQFRLASYFEDKKNYSNAIRWYRLAAERGYIEAQFQLAKIFNSGKWVPADGDEIKAYHNDIEAIRWYKEAAEHGHREAMNELIHTYMYNDTVQDYNEAVKWCNKCLVQGYINSRIFSAIGWEYYTGEHLSQDYKKAFKWSKIAAENEDTLAQLTLAEMYKYGKGTHQSDEKAFKWYEKAANKGNLSAQYSLGCMYYTGEGTTKNLKQSAIWYKKAADSGYGLAQFSLAQMYYKGEGVIQNYVEAYMWANIAAMQDERFRGFRNTIKKEMTIVQIAEGQKKAMDFYEKQQQRNKKLFNSLLD